MAVTAPGEPLAALELPVPTPRAGERLLRVRACGVCRTDLHLLDGEVGLPSLPRVLGHQVVGEDPRTGERVGVAWLASTCGECRYCRSGRENLCPRAEFTGRDRDGGYAEWLTARSDHCLPLPADRPAEQLAPLLCGGAIGYRALSLSGDGERLGLYGFGAAAHIVAQVASWQGRRVFAFTRPGDHAAQALALRRGAAWAGGSDERPPEPLDAAIVFAPVGGLVPVALGALAPGGTVVCGGIHMSDIPAFPYELLWHERGIRSVANLTRDDGRDLLDLATRIPIETDVTPYPLDAAGRALDDLRSGRLTGAAVLVP